MSRVVLMINVALTIFSQKSATNIGTKEFFITVPVTASYEWLGR